MPSPHPISPRNELARLHSIGWRYRYVETEKLIVGVNEKTGTKMTVAEIKVNGNLARHERVGQQMADILNNAFNPAE